MLVELLVENYAVVERLRVRFHPGLNLLTGETGSGKSIVVDALGLLFGARAAAEAIRTGADRARVSGVFEVPPAPELKSLLDDAGVEIEDGELIVEREIQTGGKSRAFVGGRAATAALLRDIAPYLGDIHGQHEQQSLFSPAAQAETLDQFARDTVAGAAEASSAVADAYRSWRAAATELEALEKTEQERARLVDLWDYQRKEIEAVEPKLGEDEELAAERLVLRNLVKLQETASAAYAELDENHASVSERLGSIVKRLDEIGRIDANAAEIAAQLQPACIAVGEAINSLRHYLGKLEADPGRLDDIEARLAALEKLKRKYGSTTGEILAFLETLRADLAAAQSSSERGDQLRKDSARLKASCESAMARQSEIRKNAAKQLGKRVEAELAALSMEKTRVEIRVSPAEWTERGADAVEFLLAPNVGEEPKPLDKIASGGELSRVALALKTCTSTEKPSTGASRTMVFDEVDAGVGGSAAESVGRRLKKLSRSAQVLCVTHLAQVASFADHHYLVEKRTSKGRTTTTIEELDAAARAREVARMISGEELTPEAVRHAERLIKAGAA